MLTVADEAKNLVSRVEGICLSLGILAANQALLVACSGGADSLALSEILYLLQKKYRFRLGLAHYEHGIRGAASLADEGFVAAYAQERGLEYYVACGQTPSYAREKHLSLETAARELRYAFLVKIRQEKNFSWVALAHHADDQAETVLLHLLRGAGPAGLRGMAPKRERFVRPLLGVSKAELIDFCRLRRLAPRQDATNELTDATRNKIRQELLPHLREFNPNLTEGLGNLALLAGEWHDCLTEQAAKLWPSYSRQSPKGYPELCAACIAEPPAIVGLLLQRLVGETLGKTADFYYRHYKNLKRLLRGECSRVSLPGDLEGVLRDGYLRLRPCKGEKARAFSRTLSLPGVCRDEAGRWQIKADLVTELPDSGDNALFYGGYEEGLLAEGLTVRSRKDGDTVRLSLGRKKLKKIFNEAKIPPEERETYPIVEADGQIIWVPGLIRSNILPFRGKNKFLLLEYQCLKNLTGNKE